MTQILPALFSPTVPKLVSQKEKGKDVVLVCMSACYQSPWASVRLLQSCSRYRRQHCLDRVPLTFLRLWPPRQAATGYRAPTEGPHCLCRHTFGWKPRAHSKLIVSELTASLQKGLNACSLIIWILVNWINCWIETVLLKMTKTQGQGEQKGGLISFLFTLGLSEDTSMHTLTHTRSLSNAASFSLSLTLCFYFTHTHTHTAAVCDPTQKNER